ncbi:hypothetical protein VQ02_20710 [Methylobacterium variabile]|jgi:hypothetical protein|uniref:DNA binding HTH domain-containing protein n=1 Tax=Methylobacterium variabile TaxID=298794 RepID=A0A0J6SIU8_9HYPH|nr:helix-turn-helix domain-containing protein [Methylobacterium variabile]KMO33524.1 hypothetical protein VQ02_20710 [Methylobacterium variabile]
MAPAITLADAERKLVIETLIRCRGNRTHAAKMLGVSVRTVRNRIAEYRRIGVCLPIYRDVVWADWSEREPAEALEALGGPPEACA